MFDFVRKHTKIMQFLLFLLIFPSFVLFGLEGYSRMREKGTVVATVNGVDILQSELDNAHKIQIDRMRASMPNLDAKLLDSSIAKQATLDRLVRERLLQVASSKNAFECQRSASCQ
jgi:peptidyl-prolyl cis-trans isomerase D